MAQEAKSLKVIIQDSSQAQVYLQYSTLTGGQWESAPEPGTVISPTNTPSYVNFGTSPFDTIGGTIALAPASGGQISITWNWPAGSMASAQVSSNSLTGLAVAYTLTGTQTLSPTLQVLVTNASSLTQLAHS